MAILCCKGSWKSIDFSGPIVRDSKGGGWVWLLDSQVTRGQESFKADMMLAMVFQGGHTDMCLFNT